MDENELENLHDRLDTITDKLNNLREIIEANVIIEKMDKIANDLKRLDDSILKVDKLSKEMSGAIIMARSLLHEGREKTPKWYKISDSDQLIPTNGEIWVKDINGAETIATCLGKAIIYPASSTLKKPEFWKPV